MHHAAFAFGILHSNALYAIICINAAEGAAMDFIADLIIEGIGAAFSELIERMTVSRKKTLRIIGFIIIGLMIIGIILLIVFFGPSAEDITNGT